MKKFSVVIAILLISSAFYYGFRQHYISNLKDGLSLWCEPVIKTMEELNSYQNDPSTLDNEKNECIHSMDGLIYSYMKLGHSMRVNMLFDECMLSKGSYSTTDQNIDFLKNFKHSRTIPAYEARDKNSFCKRKSRDLLIPWWIFF